MKYRVRHTTAYAYSQPVDLAAHLLHLRPRPVGTQTVAAESLAIMPAPTRRVDRRDHFGNPATWLFFDRPHQEFEVTSEFSVEVRPQAGIVPERTLPWEAVRMAAQQPDAAAWQAAEFRFDSAMAPALDAARDYATRSFASGRPVLAALCDLTTRICRDFTFRPGVTTISTPVAEVLQRREGVCQDFTHLMLSALRGLGLPARYTSGYIRTRPAPGQARRRGADQSHAWAGCWLGPGQGWIGLDPTNGMIVNGEHVLLAFGRDFADVSPVRGIILGGGRHELRVAVDMEPLAPVPD